MRGIFRLAIALAIIGTFLLSIFPVAAASANDNINYATDHILVKFKTGVSAAAAHSAILRNKGLAIREFNSLNVQVVRIPDGQVQEQIKLYRNDSAVEYAEPDYKVKAVGIPDDPGFINQWGLTRIQAPQAWDITSSNSTVKIAILDTGIDQDHEDLAIKVVANQNFSSSTTADDLFGHGTHVAGIAAAITNNSLGVAGAGDNSSLMNVKVLDDTGSGYDSWIAGGITWAADNGAKVINLSLGGPDPSSTLENAVNYAWNKGVVVVAAAGNTGDSLPSYPAYYTNCIAVAASDQNDLKASFSTYGTWVDVAAPGVNIYSTLPNHPNNIGTNYGFLNGTSMAAPFASGLAALVWSSPYGTSSAAVRNQIQSTADRVTGTGTYWQYGRINAYHAVSFYPSVTTLAATNISLNSAILNGNLDSEGSATSANVSFQWDTVSRASSGSYAHETAGQILTATGPFSANLNGLMQGNTYYFRARASIGTNVVYGGERSFTILDLLNQGRIAFASSPLGNDDIFIMNSDGANRIQLTTNPYGDDDPAFSPDGTKIAYSSEIGGPNMEIFTMNSDGSHKVNLTNHSGGDGYPTWSPDGTRIAFVSDREGINDIYVMNSDGSNVNRLTNNSAYEGSLNWSPDNMRIAFVSNRDLGNPDPLSGIDPDEIYTMNVDGSKVIRLTNNTNNDNYPAWSPDGSRITFTSWRDVSQHSSSGIYIMNSDGTNQIRLTDGIFSAWSSDGTKIAYIDNTQNICVMNADGTNPTRITNVSQNYHGLSWVGGSKAPPSVTTNEATDITMTSASLNARLVSNGSYTSANVSFEWGTNRGGPYPNATSAQSLTNVGDFSTNITGLSSITAYYFRSKAISGSTIVFGAEKSFTTQCSLTVNVTGSGIVSKSPDQAGYDSGSSVQLTAIPGPGWVFNSWSGNLTGNLNPASLIMNGNRTIMATFTPISYPLMVNVTGNGTVSGNQSSYYLGSPVSLNVTAAAGWKFGGWSGSGLSIPDALENPLGFTMPGNPVSLNATFVLNRYFLTVKTGGNGSVSGNNSWYGVNESVSLNATPARDWTFSGWTSQEIMITNSTANPLTFRMPEKNISVTAVFIPKTTGGGSPGGGGGNTSGACGGGGGGYTPSPLAPKPVSFSGLSSAGNLVLDVSGRVQDNTGVKSEDGNLTLDIAKNTILCEANGVPLKNLSVKVAASPPSPPPAKSLLLAYELGPEGALFNPAITLSLAYNPKVLPEGTLGESVTLAFWDGSQWVTVDSKIDKEQGKISASISHFSIWGLLATVIPPAKYTVFETERPSIDNSMEDEIAQAVPASVSPEEEKLAPEEAAIPSPISSSITEETTVPKSPLETNQPKLPKSFTWAIISLALLVGIALVLLVKNRSK